MPVTPKEMVTVEQIKRVTKDNIIYGPWTLAELTERSSKGSFHKAGDKLACKIGKGHLFSFVQAVWVKSTWQPYGSSPLEF